MVALMCDSCVLLMKLNLNLTFPYNLDSLTYYSPSENTSTESRQQEAQVRSEPTITDEVRFMALQNIQELSISF